MEWSEEIFWQMRRRVNKDARRGHDPWQLWCERRQNNLSNRRKLLKRPSEKTREKVADWAISAQRMQRSICTKARKTKRDQWYLWAQGKARNISKRSVEKTMYGPLLPKWFGRKRKPVVDHQGNQMDRSEFEEMASRKGLNTATCYQRVVTYGWTIGKALGSDIRKSWSIKDTLAINGETKKIKDWAKENKIARNTLYSRMQRGWPVIDAVTHPTNSKRQRKTLGKSEGARA